MKIKETNYIEALDNIVKHGNYVESRLGGMYEELGFTYVTKMGTGPYRRGYNWRLAFTEGLQLIAGNFDSELMEGIATLRYPWTMDHAYGVKIAQQLDKVIKQLRENPGTRRAVLHIGKAEDGQEVDKPCIQTYQFIERDDTLDMFIFARSWDLMTGLPYDVIAAGVLGQAVAHILGLKAGYIRGYASSGHIYETDVEKLRELRLDSVSKGEHKWRLELVKRAQFFSLKTARAWANEQLFDMDKSYQNADTISVNSWYVKEGPREADRYTVTKELELATGLDVLVRAQGMVSGYVKGAITDQITSDQITNVGFALIDEITELINEFNWKPWKKEHPVDKELVAAEYADILAFLGLLTIYIKKITCLTVDELSLAYFTKSDENIARFTGKRTEKGY